MYTANAHLSFATTLAVGFSRFLERQSSVAEVLSRKQLALRRARYQATTTLPRMGDDSPEKPLFRVIYSPEFLKHRAPGSHPERPERLSACVEALRKEKSLEDVTELVKPTEVTGTRREKVMKAVLEVHEEDYIEELKRVAEKGGGGLDPDTFVHSDSYEVALLAVSAWMDAVNYALENKTGAFALARPPGHHATPQTGMGFCLLSNAAIVAKFALKKGVKNVSILDFDVHHGNGTEASILDSENIRFCSSHQYPLYPGTGKAEYTGKLGNIKNVELESGTGMKSYEKRFDEEILGFLTEKKPELLIVSCGYDALEVDPLAQLEFEPKDFGTLTTKILDKLEHSTVVFGLEGGYDLEGISEAFLETLKAFCMREKEDEDEVH